MIEQIICCLTAQQLNKAKRFRDEYDETKVGERDMKQNEKGETKELFLFVFFQPRIIL